MAGLLDGMIEDVKKEIDGKIKGIDTKVDRIERKLDEVLKLVKQK
jgi:hypothetical protein